MTFKYIELFAGCGGLSLGLKSVGFDLVMANELSPMAAETYAYNFFKEDLAKQATQKTAGVERTLWLSSTHPIERLDLRLRENPKEYPELNLGNSEVRDDGINLQGGLVVGSIVQLNEWLEERPSVADRLHVSFGEGELDLVSGGPPCQSFSMAGLRELESDKNTLPWEFAKFAKAVRPKLVLLENVTGILRPFTDKNGDSFYAWFEVAKAFAGIGYLPLCLHVNAKNAGVAQNRPRFILLGVRADIFELLRPTLNQTELTLFEQVENFFTKVNANVDVTLEDLQYRDLSRPTDLSLFRKSFLHHLVVKENNFASVKEAIDDLRDQGSPPSAFVKNLTKTFSKVIPKRDLQNHELRSNNPLVKRRFRLYQVLQTVESDLRKRVLCVLRGETHDLEDSDWAKLANFKYLIETGKQVQFRSKDDFLAFLGRHITKKQTQKALLADMPAPAALSIPDDACHYHEDQQRTLTVREMARIQSFPDCFAFRSKITTGGKMRSFEVPQYTQVGNAVPPLLGRALGLVATDLLKRI